MDHDSKSVAAILYGIVFVLGLKLCQFLIAQIAPSFAANNGLIVTGLAAIFGALIAFGSVGKLFPKFFSQRDIDSGSRK
jgi:hypothetical protein